MNKKILPMENPPLTSYHTHADLLSVIYGKEEYESWLLNNYIQLITGVVGTSDFGVMDFYHNFPIWESCPFIEYQRITYEFANKNWPDIVECIISCIDSRYYVHIDYDRYFLPEMWQYNKTHNLHDMFIYGYDKNSKELYVTEYIKPYGEYTRFTMDFDKMILAYDGMEKYDCSGGFTPSGVVMISYAPQKVVRGMSSKYKVNINHMLQCIRDYLNGENSNEGYCLNETVVEYRKTMVFGINVYNNALYYVKNYLKENPDRIENRIFHILLEHKQMMLLRIKYLGENGYLNDSQFIYIKYKEITTLAYVLKNLHNKYTITTSPKLLNKMSVIIEEIRDKEISILKYLLKNVYIKQKVRPRIIDEVIECVPHNYFLEKRKGDYELLPTNFPFTDGKTESIYWDTENENQMFEIITQNDDNILIHYLKEGFGHIFGKDSAGKIKVIYEIDCRLSSFITNMKLKGYKGFWKETNDGLQGEGNHEYILFEKVESNFIFEVEITLLGKESVAFVVTRAKSDMKHYYNIGLDAATGNILIWHKDNVIWGKAAIKVGIKQLVRIISYGMNMDIYLNEKLMFNFITDDLKYGYVGFMVDVDKSVFQNARLTLVYENLEKTNVSYLCGRWVNEIGYQLL